MSCEKVTVKSEKSVDKISPVKVAAAGKKVDKNSWQFMKERVVAAEAMVDDMTYQESLTKTAAKKALSDLISLRKELDATIKWVRSYVVREAVPEKVHEYIVIGDDEDEMKDEICLPKNGLQKSPGYICIPDDKMEEEKSVDKKEEKSDDKKEDEEDEEVHSNHLTISLMEDYLGAAAKLLPKYPGLKSFILEYQYDVIGLRDNFSMFYRTREELDKYVKSIHIWTSNTYESLDDMQLHIYGALIRALGKNDVPDDEYIKAFTWPEKNFVQTADDDDIL